MMAYLESLAGRKSYFKDYEDALKANISVLVPNFMSMESFTKSLQNLREGNMEAARESGSTTDDPLGEIRKFLSSAGKCSKCGEEIV